MTPALDGDLLTRTTLQVAGSPPDGSIAHMIRALRDVPGVLLAEVDAACAGTLVAHDSAVPTTALVAAARSAGVDVRIVGDMQASALAPPRRSSAKRILSAAVMAVFVLTLVDVFVPDAGQRQTILIAATAALWAFFLTTSFTANR